MTKLPKFSTQHQKDFVVALNSRVNQYFKDNNLSRNADGPMILKSAFFLSLWIGSYAALIFGDFATPVYFALWAVLGFSIAMVTVNIGHDAIHGAYSNKKWVNQILSHTFNFNGASAYMWHKMHNVAHHTYTNIDGYDEDIAPIPVIRLAPTKPLLPVHKYQHIYFVFFYGLASISWVFVKDYVKFFKNEVGNYGGKPHPTSEYFYLFLYKLINYSIFLIIPMIVMPLAWWQILLGFFLMHFVAGMFLAVIFMLAHVVEETAFPNPDDAGLINHNWTVHQLYTTANFASQSKLAAFLTGGLNQQVEHHLFPNVCSTHYPALSNIVKSTAEQFGLPYFDSSFAEAFKSHHRFLYKLGHTAPVAATPSVQMA